MIKFCPECGTKLSGGRFCSNCGADLNKQGAGAAVHGEATDDIKCKSEEECICKEEDSIFAEAEKMFMLEHSGSTYTLTGVKDKSITVAIIPEGVTIIGFGALQGWESLTSVTIPHGVTEIEANAFADCYKLKSVIIPHGVIKIGLGAFTYCKSLTSVTIPNSVKEIGVGAFFYTALKSVTIAADCKYKDGKWNKNEFEPSFPEDCVVTKR